jgi:4-alpha-glucanotransferase
MQDILHLGSEHRMNTPGTVEGNWKWRFDWSQVEHMNFSTLREQIMASNRFIDMPD